MARSKWKSYFISKSIWRFLYFKKSNFFLKKIKKITYSRNSIVPSGFINDYIIIHKGNIFKKLHVIKYNVGFKFGEFSFSRKPFYFPTKEKKKKTKR
jgi:ribosomal protein S19